MIPLLVTLSLCAQLPEPIRVTTRLVEVNVVVRDKSGPVAGLAAGEFLLRDRGRIQKIAVFRAHSRGMEQARISALVPGEFTNRRDDDVAVVIVWVRLNSYFEDAASGRGQVLKALGQIQAGDRVGLYTLDSELHVIQDFTSDSARLVEALRRYRESILPRSLDNVGTRMHSTGDTAGPTSDGLTPMGSGMAHLAAMENMFATAASAGDRARRTAIAVQTIANHLAGVPGRKSVIWIAGEFPGAAAAFVNAGITVYPVDLTGVIPPSGPRKDTRPLPERTLFERMIAHNSGGVAFVDNDVRAAIDQAVKDSSVSYTLGFYPDRTPDRGNALKVEVTRKGLDIGYRSAYSGVAKPERAVGIENALASPLDATEIQLNVRLERQAEGWRLSLEIDPADVTLTNMKGGVDINLRQISAEGAVLGTTRSSTELQFNEARYRVFLGKKHALNLAIPNPKPGLAMLRLVMEDRVSGRVGSITIPVPR